jgi:hypothetical protein
MSVRVFDHLWVRLIVNLKKEGERIGVFVEDGDVTWIPVNYSAADLDKVCANLFQTLLGIYQGDVNVFVHGDERLLTIGFGTVHPK